MVYLRRWIGCIRDPFSGLSHWVGSALSVAGLVWLLVLARGRPLPTFAFAVYGGTLVLLYTASATMHSVRCSGKLEDWLNRFDYMGIFLLIAGTYTPICLLLLKGAWGWGLFAAEWAMAAAGVVAVFAGKYQSDWGRVIIYSVMGWLALIAMAPLRASVPAEALAWLLGGGAIYSVGAVIFATRRPRLWPGVFAAHDLWHVFVLAGSACHFVLVARFAA